MEKYLGSILKVTKKDSSTLIGKLENINRGSKSICIENIGDMEKINVLFNEVENLEILDKKSPKSENRIPLKQEIPQHEAPNKSLLDEIKKFGPTISELSAILAQNIINFMTSNFNYKRVGILIKDDVIGGKVCFNMARMLNCFCTVEVIFIGKKCVDFNDQLFYLEKSGDILKNKFKGEYDIIVVSSEKSIENIEKLKGKNFLFMNNYLEGVDPNKSYLLTYGPLDTFEKNKKIKSVYIYAGLSKTTLEKYKILNFSGKSFYFLN